MMDHPDPDAPAADPAPATSEGRVSSVKEPGWDDYAYFAAVARTGGLMRAAEATGASPATLSRRMRALEARLGRRLFRHGREGYALTADGRALAERTGPMEAAAVDILHWRAAAAGPVPVRISAGTWTALDLAANLARYWAPDHPWVPEFVHCDLRMDLARREIDVGVRNARPDQPWLAGRRTGRVAYAAYATSRAVSTWIGPSHDADPTPSGRWVSMHHAGAIGPRANTPRLAAEMARTGAGRVVLPTFVGDAMAPLVRVSDPIEALASEEWLVSHQDGRHEPAIRAALDALAGWLAARGDREAA